MSFKIIWTSKARSDYWNNIDYLEAQWSEKEVKRFIAKTDDIIEKIAKGKVSFLSTDFENISKVVVVKQIMLFYKVDKNNLYILRFWNTSQNPDSLVL